MHIGEVLRLRDQREVMWSKAIIVGIEGNNLRVNVYSKTGKFHWPETWNYAHAGQNLADGLYTIGMR